MILASRLSVVGEKTYCQVDSYVTKLAKSGSSTRNEHRKGELVSQTCIAPYQGQECDVASDARIL